MYSKQMATKVKEIAHPGTEAIVQAKVDPDPTVGQDINTKTIVLTELQIMLLW